ncbi:transcription factor PIF3-like [Tripterygium wilfordii]|uniref:Transcription factor PIF3-like n=1 Tax=Tripterygium wilfordii TaxID=458696 RepID=A0A7J7CHB3_TRIWF|nr:transcription factor PIF3-like [Tripterygium wilfordii]XP_038682272.1 transcription factor PIF3-like [Tripterygium wilfordii]KAF5733419.1 transcription factor PIF3-like [Tripterygium wilfordii]
MLRDFAKSSFQIRRCGDVAEVVLGFVPSCAAQEATYSNSVRLGTHDDKCVFQVQLPESVSAKNQTIPVNNNVPPDEESKAFGDEDESNKRNLTTGLSTAPSVAFSSGSPGASSDSMSSPKRSYDESEDFTHLSDSVEEEPVMRSERSGGAKRRRSSEVHNSSERRRREKINEKMRVLQDLLPNCNKVDKASMLEEAIEYLKTLQFQLQTMSMGWLLPSMMFMGRMRQLPPYQFAPMDPPPQPQFLNTSPMMQGRPSMSVPLPPFFNPLFGMPSSSSSTQSVPVTNPFEQLGCGLFSQSNSKNHSQL